jgi:hypothetical protein
VDVRDVAATAVGRVGHRLLPEVALNWPDTQFLGVTTQVATDSDGVSSHRGTYRLRSAAKSGFEQG